MNERYVIGNGGTGEPSLTWHELAMYYLRCACHCMIQAMPESAVDEMQARLIGLVENTHAPE